MMRTRLAIDLDFGKMGGVHENKRIERVQRKGGVRRAFLYLYLYMSSMCPRGVHAYPLLTIQKEGVKRGQVAGKKVLNPDSRNGALGQAKQRAV